MAQATIQVSYVNDPKPGKKMGNIKDAHGETYWVWANELSHFRPGMECQINYKTGGDRGDLKTVVGAPTEITAPVKQSNGSAPATNGAAKGLWLKLAVEQFDRPLGDLWHRYKQAEEIWDRGGAVDLEDSF